MLLVVAVLGLMAGGAQAAPIAYVDIALTNDGGHAVDIDHVGQVIQVDLVLYIKNLVLTGTTKRECFFTTFGNIISTGALKGGMVFDPDDARGVGAVGWWINENYINPATADYYAYNRLNVDPMFLNIGSSTDVDGDGDLDIGHATNPDKGLQAVTNDVLNGSYSPTDGNVTLGGTVYAKFFLARGLEFTVDAQMLSIGESTVIKFAPANNGTSAQVKSDGVFTDLYGTDVPVNLDIGNGTTGGVTLTSIVPEPATMVLLGLGGAVVAIRRRRVA